MPAAAAKTQHTSVEGGHEASAARSAGAARGEQSVVGNLEIQQWLRNDALQAQLRLGSGDDPSERDADRSAAAVLHGAGGARPPSRRRVAGLRGTARAPGGRPLSGEQRRYYEPRFGRDLSPVRLHTGAPAARASRALDARAFALGSDIAFAGGEYSPGTHSGQRLLAHELAHVVQEANGQRPVIRRNGPRTSGGENPVNTSGPSQADVTTLSNQDLIAEVASVRTWLQSHSEESDERALYTERQRLLLAEKQRRISAGHAWLAHTDESTPAVLFQLVQMPEGMAIVRVTDSRVMTEPGGLDLGGSRVVTQDQADAIRNSVGSSTGAGSGTPPPTGTAGQPFDPVAAALNDAFGGRSETPYVRGGPRAPGTVRVVAPSGQTVSAPYIIVHPGEVPGAFGGGIMQMDPLLAGQIRNPGANMFQAAQSEMARGPNAGEVSVRQMAGFAQNAPEVRIMLARVGNELVFVGYDTSQYSQHGIHEGYVESQTGSGGVGRALFADRVFRALQRGVPEMHLQVGNSQRTAAFHQNISQMAGRSETPAQGEHYRLNTREMVQVLLQSSEHIPEAQRSRLQAMVAGERAPAPAEVARVLGEIPEPPRVAIPGGGGYLRAFGVGAGFGAAVPTLIQGGQMLMSGQAPQNWGSQLTTTAGLGLVSGGTGGLVEQGVLNALGPSMGTSVGGRMLGGGLGGGIAAPIFVMGSMAMSEQSYPTSEYVAQGGRAATSGLLSGALAAGTVAAIWGSEVPLLGNVVGFAVGFFGYIIIDSLIGEDVANALRHEFREVGAAIDWAARESPGSFIPSGMVTPLVMRGGYGGLLRSPADLAREQRARPRSRR